MMGRSRHLREAGYGDELRMPAWQTEKLSGNCGGSAADAGADFIKIQSEYGDFCGGLLWLRRECALADCGITDWLPAPC